MQSPALVQLTAIMHLREGVGRLRYAAALVIADELAYRREARELVERAAIDLRIAAGLLAGVRLAG